MYLSVLGIYLFFLAISAQHASASCECGYTVNSTFETTSDNSYALFTDLLETDFLHLYTHPRFVTDDDPKAVGWTAPAYTVSPSAARGPYGKSSEVGNVVINPLKSTDDWGGKDGVNGGPPGLQLWVRGVNNLSDYVRTDPTERGKMVKVSEIDSLRSDVRYGSFRIGMKMGEVEGTCAAFFWYRNNTQEIDLEYLSQQTLLSNSSSKINLVIQSPLSAALNYNAQLTTTFSLYPLPFLPGTDYHEYRFDWTPTSISFYADGIYLASFDQYDPNAEGTLMLNHWSNGDSSWSGGPPATDTAITISYIKAYFNSTDEIRNEQWRESCTGRLQNRTCEIPAFPEEGISPLGERGNETGKTEFFMYLPENQSAVVNQTVYPAATALPSGSMRVEKALWQTLLIVGLLDLAMVQL